MSASNEQIFEIVADNLTNGNLSSAYDLMLSGVRTKTHALALRCLEFYLWAAGAYGDKAADEWTAALVRLADGESRL